jgi:hypothetical protein
MTAKILDSNSKLDGKTILEMLLSSWLHRNRSTTEILVIKKKNDSAILLTFSRNGYVEGVFECGLLECLNFPWLAASPDAVTIMSASGDKIIATVEVKT